MSSGSPPAGPNASNRFRNLASNPYRPQVPALVGLLICLLAWGVTDSTRDLEISLFVLCVVTVSWETLLLIEQNRAESRPSPEKVEAHNWLRARAIAWSVVAVAAAGLILTAARLNGGVSPALIPANNFPLTEIVILALSIAILAVLTRYSAISSYVESSRASGELGRVLAGVRDSLDHLESSIQGLTREVSQLGSAQAARPRLRGSVFHVSRDKSTHQIAWRLSAVEARAHDVKLTLSVDGMPRAPVELGEIEAGAHQEGVAGTVTPRPHAGEISMEVSFADSNGRRYTDSFDFVYTVETGFWGGIKAVDVARA